MHNYQNFIDFDYYFNLFKPDCVILVTAEYATTRSYFNPERLREKRLNPPYETVKHVVHAERNMEELEYTIDTKDAITTVSLELERPYSMVICFWERKSLIYRYQAHRPGVPSGQKN